MKILYMFIELNKFLFLIRVCNGNFWAKKAEERANLELDYHRRLCDWCGSYKNMDLKQDCMSLGLSLSPLSPLSLSLSLSLALSHEKEYLGKHTRL